jgi:hypothetical protein
MQVAHRSGDSGKGPSMKHRVVKRLSRSNMLGHSSAVLGSELFREFTPKNVIFRLATSHEPGAKAAAWIWKTAKRNCRTIYVTMAIGFVEVSVTKLCGRTAE